MEAILIKVRISILENEMAYNKEMEKMLVAFKKRALWPDYFLMDDKSLIEQTLSKREYESDHDLRRPWDVSEKNPTQIDHKISIGVRIPRAPK